MSEPDPRVYFAAERTLLAWVRTGIAVMAFGFVVARFGLFLTLVQQTPAHPVSSKLSPYIGAALVVIGAAAIAAGTLQYQRYSRTLPPADLPSPRATFLPMALAWLIVALGLALVFVLLTT